MRNDIVKERISKELVNFLLPGEVVPSEVVISVYYPNSIATLRLGGDKLQRVVKDVNNVMASASV
jgi:hypothetical protein